MATSHVEGKLELTIITDNFGIMHVIEKCLCAMFGFQLGTMHISKDNMCDDNVTKFVYHIPFPSAQGL
jgi:hypothetical protein